MDRREFVKGAGGVLTAAQAIAMGIDVGNVPLWGKEMNYRPPGYKDPPAPPKPYDPVAVLEAMRERKIRFGIDTLQFDGFVRAEWPNGDFTVDENDIAVEGTDTMLFPDFTSAVRWLHQQAADADKTFAEKWPVPE